MQKQSLRERLPIDSIGIKFEMATGTIIECGIVIAGIQNKMPFTKFKVYTDKDSLIASNQDQILDLFAKTFWGNLKTPCELIIK